MALCQRQPASYHSLLPHLPPPLLLQPPGRLSRLTAEMVLLAELSGGRKKSLWEEMFGRLVIGLLV